MDAPVWGIRQALFFLRHSSANWNSVSWLRCLFPKSAELSLALRASELLFGIAQKVAKKASTHRGGSIRIVRIELPCASRRRERRPGSTNPCIPALLCRDRCLSANRARAVAVASAAGSRPNGAPCGAASVRRGKPEGWRARCAPVRCMHMDVHSANPGTRSRTRRAGCPESALLGVCFFRLPFFAQAKKGDSLARRASESFALQRARSWIPAFAGMTSNNKPLNARESARRRSQATAAARRRKKGRAQR